MPLARAALERGSATLSYTVVGSGPTLIVVPGGPGFGFGYLYEPLLELLGTGRRLVFYDQRGSGHSTGHDDPERLTMRAFVRDLHALQRAVGAVRADVLGHSFGGLLALQYALQAPERVRSVLLVDSDPARWEDWRRFRAVLESRRTREEQQELEAFRARPGWKQDPERLERYFQVYLRPYFGIPSAAARLRFHFHRDGLEKINATATALRADLGEWDMLAALPRIEAPTLLVHGASGIFPLPSAEAMQKAMPNCELQILPAAGHFPFLEAPEAFRQAVAHFLQRHSPLHAAQQQDDPPTIPPWG